MLTLQDCQTFLEITLETEYIRPILIEFRIKVSEYKAKTKREVCGKQEIATNLPFSFSFIL